MAKGTAPRSERFKKEAARLVTQASADTSSSSNEATLRHRLEQALSVSCGRLSIKALPYHFDVRLQLGLSNQFADVIHGAVIIEYEPPRSFNGREGQVLAHAKSQAEGYRQRVQKNEGRPLNDYAMVVWDGSHIAFGRDEPPVWSRIRAFDESAAMKLLDLLDKQGMPLVHPTLLTELIGPESKAGSELIPALFRIATERGRRAHAHTTRTGLLYSEWRRLCGQVLGNTSEHVTEFVRGQSSSHHEAYENDPDAFLFALNTHVALTAKLVAALSLPQAAQDLRDPTVDLRERIHQLDSGSLFAAAGIEGMLDGDFFSWVADDPEWHALSKPLGDILSQLDCLDFDVSKRTPEAARDLFKGIYEAFIPSALRHALGEYYTPDWLAEYLLDEAGWQPSNSLLDPTCGSGTFILEALRRRLADNCTPRRAADLLKGLYGTDLNPLAVLASRASLVVYLAPFFDRTHPVRLPIYLADAVNTVDAIDTFYSHRIQTERGVKTFVFPQQLVADGRAYRALDAIRRLLDAVPIRSTPGPAADGIYSALSQDFGLAALPPDEQNTLRKTVRGFVDLHLQGWNGIWCTILSERLAAATIPTVDFICGNPPWVKWSNLPPTYAALIKPRCDALGVFSQDRWVGGIEADISTVITYEAIDKWLKPGGVLAFSSRAPCFGMNRVKASGGSR